MRAWWEGTHGREGATQGSPGQANEKEMSLSLEWEEGSEGGGERARKGAHMEQNAIERQVVSLRGLPLRSREPFSSKRSLEGPDV